MSCRITTSEDFERRMKRLAKKYRSMKQDYALLLASLTENPFQGADLGQGLRKVRMAIASKGKGKSGGARVITITYWWQLPTPRSDFFIYTTNQNGKPLLMRKSKP